MSVISRNELDQYSMALKLVFGEPRGIRSTNEIYIKLIQLKITLFLTISSNKLQIKPRNFFYYIYDFRFEKK